MAKPKLKIVGGKPAPRPGWVQTTEKRPGDIVLGNASRPAYVVAEKSDG